MMFYGCFVMSARGAIESVFIELPNNGLRRLSDKVNIFFFLEISGN